MSDGPPPEAEYHPSRWPGWIWSVPIAAIGVVLWLGIRSWASSGPNVTVIFPGVAALQPGDTKVTFENMEVGTVTSVRLEKDLHHLRVTLAMRGEMAGHLGKGTEFWIAGASPSLDNIASLRAIISGPSVGIRPAPGRMQKIYQGLAQRPAVPFGAAGRIVALHTDHLGAIRRGTPIYYLGETAGMVTDVRMTGPHGFDISAFITAPYDRFVRTGSRFWRAGPLKLETGGTGPSVQFQSIAALLQGAIAFEAPEGRVAGARSRAEAHFALYESEQAARYAPTPQAVLYRVRFPNASGVLAANAAVTLEGTRVGSVVSSQLVYDPASGTLGIEGIIALEPDRIALAGGARWVDPRRQMDAMLERLLAQGLEATLAANPPILGGQTVALRITPGAHGALIREPVPGSIPQLPTAPGPDIAAILADVGAVTAEIEKLPVDEIGQNVAQATRHVSTLVGAPQLRALLVHLENTSRHADVITLRAEEEMPRTLSALREAVGQADAALASAEAMLSSAEEGGGEIAPETNGLPNTLYEVSRAARAIRTLADFLDTHPSALLTGRGRGG